jgi:hypothetical protein
VSSAAVHLKFAMDWNKFHLPASPMAWSLGDLDEDTPAGLQTLSRL